GVSQEDINQKLLILARKHNVNIVQPAVSLQFDVVVFAKYTAGWTILTIWASVRKTSTKSC
ncbi:MAG: hypothetical protein AAFN65_15840, partial [Bacteroidota bacterium]